MYMCAMRIGFSSVSTILRVDLENSDSADFGCFLFVCFFFIMRLNILRAFLVFIIRRP